MELYANIGWGTLLLSALIILLTMVRTCLALALGEEIEELDEWTYESVKETFETTLHDKFQSVIPDDILNAGEFLDEMDIEEM